MDRRTILGGLAAAFLSGCGGGSEDPAPAASPAASPAAGTEGLPAALLTADPIPQSTAAQSSLSDLMHSQGLRLGTVGNSIINSQTAFWLVAASNSGGRIIPERTRSVGGVTSSALVGQVALLDSNCNSVLMMEGTNDGSQGVPLATHVANMRAAVDAVRGRGWLPILIATPPTDRAFSAATSSMALADRFLAESEGIPFFDPWGRVTDTDGTWMPGASADQIHPIPATERAVGDDLWAMMVAGETGYLLPRSNTGLGLFGSSGNQLQLLDSDNDGLPNGWKPLSLTGPTFSAAPIAHPFRGKKCSAKVAQASQGYIYRTFNAAGVTPGDVVRLTGFVSLANSVNMKVRVFYRFNTVLVDVTCAVLIGDTGDRYFEAEVQVPAGLTDMTVFIQCAPQTTGSFFGTVGFGGFDVYNVTRNTL